MYSNWNVLTLPIKADGKYKMLETAYQEAVRKEQYEVAGVINDTLKHNSRTLQELREECDVIQRKRQSPR